jgi:hypothetical protein
LLLISEIEVHHERKTLGTGQKRNHMCAKNVRIFFHSGEHTKKNLVLCTNANIKNLQNRCNPTKQTQFGLALLLAGRRTAESTTTTTTTIKFNFTSLRSGYDLWRMIADPSLHNNKKVIHISGEKKNVVSVRQAFVCCRQVNLRMGTVESRAKQKKPYATHVIHEKFHRMTYNRGKIVKNLFTKSQLLC